MTRLAARHLQQSGLSLQRNVQIVGEESWSKHPLLQRKLAPQTGAFCHGAVLILERFEGDGHTFVLGLGASGLRTGALFGLPADPLSGADFRLAVMLSRMFVIRG